MKFVTVITARKGSKGIKNKNIIKLNNIPLIEYTFKAVSKSIIHKNCFVLTDSNKIKKIAKKYSIDTSYIRPASTSTDNSSSISTLKHFSDWYLKKNSYDAMVLLQPTSPLRNSEDINKSIKIFKKEKIDSLFSISKHLEHPYDAINLEKKNKLKFVIKKRKKFFRRQDFDVNSYFHNGAIFIMKKNLINKNKIYNTSNHGFYIMPKARSVELDEKEDIDVIKKLLR
jgi:CMP-N,N'-diacetyllegionaminic acid synthase